MGPKHFLSSSWRHNTQPSLRITVLRVMILSHDCMLELPKEGVQKTATWRSTPRESRVIVLELPELYNGQAGLRAQD